MQIENWKPVSPELGLYQVSDQGRVMNKRGLVMKPVKLTTGYLQVMLKSRKNQSVHRLVAMAFCQGFAPGLVVNHKNGDKTDNRSENLEWLTSSENIRHGYRVLGAVGLKGRRSTETNKYYPVVATHMKTGEVLRFDCGMDAVRVGFRSDCISRACHGKIAHHAGYRWAFE